MASTASGDYPPAIYDLRVRALPATQLSFAPELNNNGLTNVASGQLADNERAFYQFTVPTSVGGAPVLGWKLDLTSSNGVPSVRVGKDLLPADNNPAGTIPFATPTATIAPSYLTPGTWYAEVKGSGATTYSLTSSAITTNTLKHVVWVMPSKGQTNVAPGLSLPMIGDSGVDATGHPLPGDQGIDLKQGYYDYYAVMVPNTNAGLLRTELLAISGNPQLYLRVGAAPTLAHLSQGSAGYGLEDRAITGAATQYGNWVPLNGRYEGQLAPGLWVLAVQAAGNANVRYRLQLSCGNSVTNGLVQDLGLNGGSFTNQNLNGGDWRYYRVQFPSNAPANWNLTFSRSLGSARVFVRDSVPPGDGNRTADYSDPNYNPGTPYEYAYPGPYYYSSFDLQSWARDGKNQGPYPRFDAPGTYSISPPPLRPGSVYYLGVWSPNDTTFSISSSTSGGSVIVTNQIAFVGGSANATLAPGGSVRYRMDVPASATRIVFDVQNAGGLVFALEQGTLAQAGGPAHWVSADPAIHFNQSLLTPGLWPWLPGYSYYLAVTNPTAASANFSLGMELPADLAPVSLLGPTNLIAGAGYPVIQIAWSVTNQGPGAATGPWYDRVWFSTNGVFDAYSVALADFYVAGPLAAGGVYWQTNAVTLPLNASASYALFVQADIFDAVNESNEGNNVSAALRGTFTINVPLAIQAPGPGQVGSSFPIIWTAQVGRSYQVQYLTNLRNTNWANLGAPLTANVSLMTVFDPLTSSNRYYRIKVLP
jgi:hypothetical protein